MELVITGKGIDVTEALRKYAADKLNRITRNVDGILSTQVEFSVIRNPSVSENQVVEVKLVAGGTVIRGEEASDGMYKSIDLVSDKIERQIRRHKQRLEDRRHNRTKTALAIVPEEAAREVTSAEEAPQIVRQGYEARPFAPEDAAYQLDLSGKDFMVFFNRETEALSVIYHRRDGNYGLIEPSRA